MGASLLCQKGATEMKDLCKQQPEGYLLLSPNCRKHRATSRVRREWCYCLLSSWDRDRCKAHPLRVREACEQTREG